MPTLPIRSYRPARGATLALALLVGALGGVAAGELGSMQSHIKGLLVVDLDGTGMAAKASQMNATATAAEDRDAPFNIRFNQEVGPEMNGALNEVGKFLNVRHGRWPSGFETEIAFEDRYSSKDGPSAAVACALMLDSLLTGKALADDIAVTGDMNADGAVRPVGGVGAKVRGAAKRDCSVVAIPEANARSVSDLHIMEGSAPLYAVQIIAVATFEEALAVATADRPEKVAAALAEFAEVQDLLSRNARKVPRLLRNHAVQDRLRSVVGALPGHLSARLLLLEGLGRSDDQLSLPGSLVALEAAATSIMRAAREDLTSGAATSALELDAIGNELSALRRLRPRLDNRIHACATAVEELGFILRDWALKPSSARSEIEKFRAKVIAAAAKVDVEIQRLRRNREYVEEVL